MKNRLLTYFLAVMMCLNIIPTAFAEESVEIGSEINFLEYIGGFEGLEVSPESSVTRGEFAAVLANICKLNSVSSENDAWVQENYGEDNKDTLIVADSSALKFTDVDTSYPYYDEILSVVNIGYMKGISENLFAPEYGVTLLQSSKVILDLLGYKEYALVYGGYPAGYESLAQGVDLTDGISKDFNDILTQADLAKLIYNALDIGIVNVTGINGGDVSLESSENETFMSEVLELDKITGTVTDNGITSYYGESALNENSIKIDEKVIEITDKTKDIRDFLGRHVEAYITNDTDEAELIYFELSGRDEIVEFDIENFEKYTRDEITFYNGSKNVTKKLEQNTCMIYNGMAVKSFDENTFDFNSGNVRLIMPDGSNVNLIIVNSYDYMYVKRTDIDKGIIYGSFVKETQLGDSLDLGEEGQYEHIYLYNETGTECAITDILPGKVLKISRSDNFIKINVVSSVIEEFKVQSMYTDDYGRNIIKGEQGEFAVLEDYANSTYSTAIKNGESYKLYLGDGNLIVWAEKAGETKDNAGYMVRSWIDDENDESVFVRVYGFDGSFQNYTLKEKVKILGKDKEKYTLNAVDAYNTHLINTNSMIKFTVNVDGLIDYIEFPTENKNIDGQLHKLFETYADENHEYYSGNYGWTGEGTIGRKIQYNSNTKFMKIPVDLKDEQKYTIPSAQQYFAQDSTREFIAYASKPNTAIADFIIFKSSSSDADLVGEGRRFIVVEKITEEYVDEEIVKKISGMYASPNGTGGIELYSKLNDSLDANGNSRRSAFDSVTDSMRTKTNEKYNTYDIKKGDIIRCIYDEYNYVTVAELVYRPTATNEEFPESKAGTIVGTSGRKPSKTELNTNPFYVHNSGSLMTSTTGCRIGYGFVLKTEDNILHYTTQDLSLGNADVNNLSSKYLWEIYKINSDNVIAVDYSENGVTVNPGSIDDIRTYEEAGSECSRILFNMYYSSQIVTVIINGTMAKQQ